MITGKMTDEDGGYRLKRCLFFLTLLILTLILPDVKARSDIQDPDSLWIGISLDLETPDKGSLEFTIRTDDVDFEYEERNLSFPERFGYYDNDNLRRVLEVLETSFTSESLFFNSIIRSEGDPILKDIRYGIAEDGNDMAISFRTEFKFPEDGSSRELDILPFVKWIRYPNVDTQDPLSISRYNNFVSEVKLCRINVEIALDSGNSLDLQFEDKGHTRDASGESVDIDMNLHDFRDKGNGVMVSGLSLFSPSILLLAVILITILEFIALAIIWWRNRFKGLGLILPIAALVSIPLNIVFYFNPQINIYSTYDAFVFASMIIAGILVALSFFINPKHEKTVEKSYEDEKAPSFEMPKVIYTNKNVYIRSKDGSGIDPYKILDVTRNMTIDEIRERYKKEVLQYHPDKFHDSPDNMRALAERELERLNQAFDQIQKERGEKDS